MTVFLDTRARDAVGIESQRRRLRETGGALFGFVDGDDVVVGCAYGPGPHARHRRSSFESHRTTTAAIMAAVRRASSQRYRFLGSWHTHPAGAAVPSYRDIQTAAEIGAEADVLLPSPLVIIQATRPRLRGAERRSWQPGAGIPVSSRWGASRLSPSSSRSAGARWSPRRRAGARSAASAGARRRQGGGEPDAARAQAHARRRR